MNKKYQVFISSTFTDLKEERQDISRSILNLDHIPAGMELFPAIDEAQFEYIKKVIDDCDYYVLIIGGRYGSLSEGDVSYTEREYDYAVSRGLKVIALIHNDTGNIPVRNSDTDPEILRKLALFRAKAAEGRLARFWSERSGLRADFIESFTMTMSRFPATGWVRGNTVPTEELLIQSNSIRNENDHLRIQIAELRALQIPTVANIADIDSSYAVHYTYTTYKGGNRSMSTYTRELSWRQIYAAIGPSLMKPTPPAQIGPLLVNYLRERLGVHTIDQIVLTDVDIIKIHFIALGLIETNQSVAVGGGVSEFVQITSKGQGVLLQSLAVRSVN